MISHLRDSEHDGGPTEPRRIELLGVPFDVVCFTEALDLLVALAQGEGSAYAVTANVDHIVRFHRCPEVRPLYERADLVVPDGMPLIWASHLLGSPLPERVAGSDILPSLCGLAAKHGLSVFLLGGDPGTAHKSAEILRAQHVGLSIAGTFCPEMGFDTDPGESARVVEIVRRAAPDILFVGLGSPKQERWIVENRTACGAKLSIGVGITFSFVCGKVKRAPRWMQHIGLEWLHRLVQEPRRLWRRYLVEDARFVTLVLHQLLRRVSRSGQNASRRRQVGKDTR